MSYYVVEETHTQTGQGKYHAGGPIHLRTHAIEKAHRYSSYPEAMAAATVLAARDGTKTFEYEVIEVAYRSAGAAHHKHPAIPTIARLDPGESEQWRNG
jgi:hypothetical protein